MSCSHKQTNKPIFVLLYVKYSVQPRLAVVLGKVGNES